MTPLRQTIFGDGKGNCFAACIASVLELPLDSVPNFCADYADDDWFEETNRWLRQHRRGLIMVSWNSEAEVLRHLDEFWPDAYCIVSGPAARGCDHSVVYQGARLVHDPHPSDAGLLSINDVCIFVQLDPRISMFNRAG